MPILGGNFRVLTDKSPDGDMQPSLLPAAGSQTDPRILSNIAGTTVETYTVGNHRVITE